MEPYPCRFKPGDKVRVNREAIESFVKTYGYKDTVYTVLKCRFAPGCNYWFVTTSVDNDEWHQDWFVLADDVANEPEQEITEFEVTEAEKELILALRSAKFEAIERKGRKFKTEQELTWQK